VENVNHDAIKLIIIINLKNAPVKVKKIHEEIVGGN
jgi:hypothetical protein